MPSSSNNRDTKKDLNGPNSHKKIQKKDNPQQTWIDVQLKENDKRIDELEQRLSRLTNKVTKPSASTQSKRTKQ